jgi:hypothetical protein
MIFSSFLYILIGNRFQVRFFSKKKGGSSGKLPFADRTILTNPAALDKYLRKQINLFFNKLTLLRRISNLESKFSCFLPRNLL